LVNGNFYQIKSLGPNPYLEGIFGVFIVLNFFRFLGLFFKKFESIRFLPSFCLVNSYGLFAKMTTKRYEINLEGSLDGTSWNRIPFKYKVEDSKRPGFQIAPLQPRLDWQMWFLALDPSNLSPWFNDFLDKLFKNSEEVISLLGDDYPFKDQPPQFIKVSVHLYRYGSISERKQNKNFWIVENLSNFVVGP
jgi:hypothetical protein